MNTKDKISNIVININNEDVYADFTYKDTDMLNESLENTITKLSKSTPLKTKLNIKMEPKKDINLNEKKFKNAFSNTYESMLQEKKHEIARCVITGLTIMAIGIALILFSVFFTTDVYGTPYPNAKLLNYVVDLLAWITIWDSVEVLTVELIQLLIERKKLKKIKTANLIFAKHKATKKSAE